MWRIADGREKHEQTYILINIANDGRNDMSCTSFESESENLKCEPEILRWSS